MAENFTGAIYAAADTAAADTARRFKTTAYKVSKAYFVATTKDQMLGTSASQVYTLAANDSIFLENVDLSTLYFKNAIAGQNGTVAVLAVEF